MSLEKGLPIIIDKKVNLSCFLGALKGTLECAVHDQGTSEFPTTVTAKTNYGNGSIQINLKGNEVIKKSISGASIEVTISQWSCTSSKLSFHVKAVIKKSILSCTVIDETLSGARHDASEQSKKMDALFAEAEKNAK